jgi:hypothetical protein
MSDYKNKLEHSVVVVAQKICLALASGDDAASDCPNAEGSLDRREAYPEMELASLPCRDDLAVIGLVLCHGSRSWMFGLDRSGEPAGRDLRWAISAAAAYVVESKIGEVAARGWRWSAVR